MRASTTLAVLAFGLALATGPATAAAQPRPPAEPSLSAAAHPQTHAALARPAAHDAAHRPALGARQTAGAKANLEPAFGLDIPLYDPSGRALAPFYDALRRAESRTGKARMLVYGASHVASDFITDRLRRGLQARFGDAGHGFIMPAKPWRSYRHLGYTVESNRRWRAHRIRATSREVDRLGLGGIAVDGSSREAWGRLTTGRHPISRFEVLYDQQPGGGSFDLRLDGRRARRVRTRLRNRGGTRSDTRQPGYAVVSAEDAPHTLEVRLRGDGPVRIFGVIAERESPGVVVDTLGLNGARASNQLLWDDALFRAHLARRRPDLIVLAYGTNESGDTDIPIEEYESRLRQVLGRLQETAPQAACLLIGPSDRPLREEGELKDRPRTAAIIATQQRVSRDLGCAFFDLVAFGGGPMSMVRWAAAEPPFAQPDLVHFTVRGYRRLGDVLLQALLDGYGHHQGRAAATAAR